MAGGALCLVAGLTALAAPPAGANATITVGQGGCTLTNALAAAQSGTAIGGCPKGDTQGLNTIVVPAGTYGFSPAFTGDVDLHVTSGRIAIVGHTASDTILDGGGSSQIMKVDAGANVTLNHLTLENGLTTGGADPSGDAVGGGAILNDGRLTIANSVITQNQTNYGGNAASTSSGIAGNGGHGGDGGAVLSTGTLTITGSILSHNTTGLGGTGGDIVPGNGGSIAGDGGSGGLGGAVAITAGRATISRSALSDNFTGGGGNQGSNSAGISGDGGDGGLGGALYTGDATVAITATTISGNYTGSVGYGGFGSGGYGGGIANGGALTLARSTVSGNTTGSGDVESTGGGIYTGADAAKQVRIVNSTIAGNGTPTGTGAGLQMGGTVALTASTVARNSQIGASGVGTGIEIDYAGDTLIERDSLVALNGAANCGNAYGGTLTSRGHNLSFPDTTCGHEVTGNPKLGPLQSNGGPTKTLAPALGSPVLGTGSAAGLTTDQRGFPRPYGYAAGGDGSDIGAFERQGPVFGGKVRVRLARGAKRIRAAGPLPVVVSNANVFRITGVLHARTAKPVSATNAGKKTRIVLKAKAFAVAAKGRATVALDLPQKLRDVLEKRGEVTLALRAVVVDPARHRRAATKTFTVRLKQ